MASSGKTTTLQLSQFTGSDIPSWLSDYNSDMSKIDTFASGVGSSVQEAVSTANTAKNTATAASQAANSASTAAGNAGQAVTNLDSAIKGWKSVELSNPNPSKFTTYYFKVKYNLKLGLMSFDVLIGANTAITSSDILGVLPAECAVSSSKTLFYLITSSSSPSAQFIARWTINPNRNIQAIDNLPSGTIAAYAGITVYMAGDGSSWPATT